VTAFTHLAPRFVGEMPEILDEGVLYVSLQHRSMLHLCACGCGSEVALPLAPLDWRFTWDGETMSVSPSVGSWSLPCRSHYVIDRGRVRWAGDWSDKEIASGRQHDRRRRTAAQRSPAAASASATEPVWSVPDDFSPALPSRSGLHALRRWISALWRGS
jgi:hypothetical protein